MDIKPVPRVTLPDGIIEQLKTLIIEGHLKPGDRLPPERELAEKLGVGRTSLREALKALSAIGVIKRTKEGTFVNDEKGLSISEPLSYSLLFKQTTVEEVFEARKLFEGGLAELAARRATAEDIAELEKALKGDDRGIKGFVESDVAFHLAIAEAVQNKVIYDLFVTVRELLFQSHRFYDSFYNPENVELIHSIIKKARQDHRDLLDAIRAQDANLARRRMYDHLDSVEKGLLDLR